MEDKVYSFMGLALKAGKLVSGEVNCVKTIRCKKAFLVIVSGDASANTAEKFDNACKYRDIPFYRFGKKEEIGRLLGKEIRSVVAVTDIQLARNLEKLIKDHQSNEKKHGGGLIE